MKLIQEIHYKASGSDKLMQTKHSHDDVYELIQILDGTGEFIINNKSYHLKKGAIFLIDAENFHYSVPQNPEVYTRNKLILSKTLLHDFSLSFGFTEQICCMFDDNNNAIYLKEDTASSISELFEIMSTNADSIKCAFAFINMLNILWENIHFSVWSDEKLNLIFESVNNHLDDDYSLELLSRETHIDKYYLCHYFKLKTEMTIFEYVQHQRIAKAKKMLKENNMTISQVAAACGYNSLSYFSKCFKKIVGMTPKKYLSSPHK